MGKQDKLSLELFLLLEQAPSCRLVSIHTRRRRRRRGTTRGGRDVMLLQSSQREHGARCTVFMACCLEQAKACSGSQGAAGAPVDSAVSHNRPAQMNMYTLPPISRAPKDITASN